MVLGMTRDELFDAFSRFVNSRAEAGRTGAQANLVDVPTSNAGPDDGPGDAIIAERGQPAKVHAKAKPKKRR
jgi:hypothetical protein